MRSATSLLGWRMDMIERNLEYKQIWVALSVKNGEKKYRDPFKDFSPIYST